MRELWQEAAIAAEGTHHVVGGLPLYEERFDEVLSFHAPGLAPVRDRSGAYHIDPSGKPAYARRFQRTFGFYEERAAVEGDDGAHHIDTQGADVGPHRFAWCGNFQGGRCAVRDPSGWYFHVDRDDRPVYGDRWRYAGDFREGLAVVQDDTGLHHHIDADGRRAGPRNSRGASRSDQRNFRDLDVFHKGFARARDLDGWFHLRRNGAPAYRQRFASVEPFYNGQSRCETLTGLLVVIDETGRVVVELSGARRFERMADMVIPFATLRWVDAAPRDRATLVLIRHAARDPIPHCEPGGEVVLTAEGHGSARILGASLGARLASARSSPVTRCLQTAEELVRGAGVPLECRPDASLGGPGVYVTDAALAWERVGKHMPYEDIVTALMAGRADLAGYANPAVAARQLIEHMIGAGTVPGVHVFVTHDSLVLPTASYLLAKPLARLDWPGFLDALVLWLDDDALEVRYRDYAARCDQVSP